ncbi:hypothetical protein MSAN_02069700 [Mycena sanguinolenta]|uniref:Uncharacterized protein n=1 Tax=Mycena sanguinolenta TaxID=230812 RepID=A0A8H7CNF7_9AGAR|nr:hypothetical protein MSAN_02069700 [Mycena sanguinolenta]
MTSAVAASTLVAILTGIETLARHILLIYIAWVAITLLLKWTEDASQSPSAMDLASSNTSRITSGNCFGPIKSVVSNSDLDSIHPVVHLAATAMTQSARQPTRSSDLTLGRLGSDLEQLTLASTRQCRPNNFSFHDSVLIVPEARRSKLCKFFAMPTHRSFILASSLLFEYMPKRAAITPYRYIASTKHLRYSFGFPLPMEDERFPVISGLTFPHAISAAMSLPQKPLLQ